MNERRWLLLVLSLYLVLGLSYSLLMPMWEAPDEHAHYLFALHIARTGQLPGVEQTYEAYQPPLYYWLMSRPLRLLDAVNADLVTPHFPAAFPDQPAPRWNWTADNYRLMVGPLLIRWLDLLLGGMALYCIYRGARRLAPGVNLLPATTVALAGLTPQFLHIAASVNNDALANLAGAFLFWQLAGVCTQEFSERRLMGVGVAALALPALTKLTVLPMGIAVLGAIAWRMRSMWREYWRWLLAGGVALGLLGAAASVMAPSVARSALSEVWWRTFYVRPGVLEPVRGSVTAYLGTMAGKLAWSYWGQVGWVTASLRTDAWVFLTAMAAIGWLASFSLQLPAPTESRRRFAHWVAWVGLVALVTAVTWWFLSLSAGLWVIVVWGLALIWWLRWWLGSTEYKADGGFGWKLIWLAAGLSLLMVSKNTLTSPHGFQGRFLFSSIGALTVLITAGWYALLPSRISRRLPHMTVLLMIALNLLLWFDEVIPTYYQPFVD